MAQNLAAAGLAAILLASQPQQAIAKDAGVASQVRTMPVTIHALLTFLLCSYSVEIKQCYVSVQEDLLTELLQKNGGKGKLLLLLLLLY